VLSLQDDVVQSEAFAINKTASKALQLLRVVKEKIPMKLARFVSASTLSVLLGTTALIGAQNRLFAQEQRDDAKPAQQEARPEPNKPEEKAPEAARPGDAKPAQQTEDRPTRTQDNSKQDFDRNTKQDDAKQDTSRQDNKASRDMQNDHSASTQRAGNRIPDDKFRANFGRQHAFAMQHPVMVGGRPQFSYGGYSFTIVDAWPVGWAYTDQCYIDYIDGEYFLFDLAHPGVRIAVIIV
jgi:hypothetical protein